MLRQRLILVGGGHAHLLVLETLEALASQRPTGLDITLISPGRWQHYSGMLPGWMKAQYAQDDCRIDLTLLAQQAGVKFIQSHVVDMDAEARYVRLSDGTHVPYDLLSLDVGSEVNTQGLTSLGEKMLPIKPLGVFSEAWPALLAQAQAQKASSWRLGVVGGGAAGVEAVLSAHLALHKVGALAQLYLITGAHGVLPGHATAVRRRVLQALRDSGVKVVTQHGVGTAEGLMLDDGELLPLDAVIAATGACAPAWLRGSQLQLDDRGFVAVNGHHQSLSHANVFAAGDVCARFDLTMARSGVHAVRVGPVLAHNLLAWFEGRAMRTYLPRRWSLYLLATGADHAVASWGPFSASGAWVWRLKDRIDRRFMQRFIPRLAKRESP